MCSLKNNNKSKKNGVVLLSERSTALDQFEPVEWLV